MSRPLGMQYPDAWYHVRYAETKGSSRRQFGGDRPGFQYKPIYFGPQYCRKNKI